MSGLLLVPPEMLTSSISRLMPWYVKIGSLVSARVVPRSFITVLAISRMSSTGSPSIQLRSEGSYAHGKKRMRGVCRGRTMS